MKRLFMMMFVFVLFSSSSFAKSTYEAVTEGKTCEEDSSQQVVCKYIVGKSLEIWITGIGMPDTGVTFARADFYNGDYYATYGIMHQCIIIKNRQFILDLAFISYKNGKVYEDWQSCMNSL
jgi:hypothetical protein